MPGMDIIRSMKGKLDFYDYKGLAVARAWPRRSSLPQSPASLAAAQAFASFSIRATSQAGVMRQTAALMQLGQPLTWKEWLTKAAYGHLHRW